MSMRRTGMRYKADHSPDRAGTGYVGTWGEGMEYLCAVVIATAGCAAGVAIALYAKGGWFGLVCSVGIIVAALDAAEETATRK